jgi:AbiJ N-terminal domain 4
MLQTNNHMSIHHLYSKRKKLIEKGSSPEIYQYEDIPMEFRRQVIHIWNTAIVPFCGTINQQWWVEIRDILLRELGLFSLASNKNFNSYDKNSSAFEECKLFLINKETSTENILDLIELTFTLVEKNIYELVLNNSNIVNLNLNIQHPNDALEELNHRFREHAIGYQFNNGQIIRIDSFFIHSEVVIPALSLLSDQYFAGAEQEFLIAHKHYREKDYKSAIANALKAFESTMKTICDKCGWTYQPTDCAKDLIKVIFQNQILPEYLHTQFSNLRSILESGIPTVRNKTSGHGQGAQPTVVPEYLTAYVLHLTASNIVFLMEAYIAQKVR